MTHSVKNDGQSGVFQQEALRGTRFLLCVPTGSSDRRLPADGGPLITGGDWSAATDPGGQRCRPRSCLLIPVQVRNAWNLLIFYPIASSRVDGYGNIL